MEPLETEDIIIEETSTVEEIETTETDETPEASVNYTYECICEHVDYTSYLETISQHTEYLTNINTHIYHNNLFTIAICSAVFACFILYSLLKKFL